ncbi:hypothetical protein THAOC_25089, partial [Thalassiosira oceanica]
MAAASALSSSSASDSSNVPLVDEYDDVKRASPCASTDDAGRRAALHRMERMEPSSEERTPA